MIQSYYKIPGLNSGAKAPVLQPGVSLHSFSKDAQLCCASSENLLWALCAATDPIDRPRASRADGLTKSGIEISPKYLELRRAKSGATP
jgi:hypothetical protein